MKGTPDSDKSQADSEIRAHFDEVVFRVQCSDSSELGALLWGRLGVTNKRPPRRRYDPNFKQVVRTFRLWASNLYLQEPDRNDFAAIVIVNSKKSQLMAHHYNISNLGLILEILRYPYHISKAEIALDTQYEKTGFWVARHVLPRWSRLDKHFNYGTGKRLDGGSENALDEYMFPGHPYRRKSEDGGEGNLIQPRRQFYCYYKDELGLWRLEMRLFTPYLREQHIRRVDDLFETAPRLIERNISFWKLDVSRLRTVAPSSRNWPLKLRSIAEQMELLMQKLRCSRKDALRFFKKVPSPNIDPVFFQLDRSIRSQQLSGQ